MFDSSPLTDLIYRCMFQRRFTRTPLPNKNKGWITSCFFATNLSRVLPKSSKGWLVLQEKSSLPGAFFVGETTGPTGPYPNIFIVKNYQIINKHIQIINISKQHISKVSDEEKKGNGHKLYKLLGTGMLTERKEYISQHESKTEWHSGFHV